MKFLHLRWAACGVLALAHAAQPPATPKRPVPARAALYEQLKRHLSDPSPQYYGLEYRGGVLFAMKSQPPKEQPFLITLASTDKQRGRLGFLLHAIPAGRGTSETRHGVLPAGLLSPAGDENGR